MIIINYGRLLELRLGLESRRVSSCKGINNGDSRNRLVKRGRKLVMNNLDAQRAWRRFREMTVDAWGLEDSE
jgi:hypothetical protein